MDDERASAAWRTVAQVALGLGWLVGVLLWWAFWSDDFTVAQRFAVALMSLIVVGTASAAMWIPFSIRHGTDADREQWADRGFTARVAASVAVFGALAAGLIYALFFPWRHFDICQSIVVIVVALIAGVVMMAPVWMRWGAGRKAAAEAGQGEGPGVEGAMWDEREDPRAGQ